jgi:V8-like Glu-specific endopeptidase
MLHWKVAALLAAAPTLLSNSGAALSGIAPWRHPEVVQIMCAKVAGTAFRVGPKLFLSVAHVTHNEGCTINDRPFKELAQQGDFAVLSYDVSDAHWLPIDCGGFKKGHRYVAIGYARAKETLTEVEMDSLGISDDGRALLNAVFVVIPGMSGGPVVDSETGKVVGTVNTYDNSTGYSGSVELHGTSVCKGVI